MSDTTNTPGMTPNEETVTVVAVPNEHAEQVMAYVKSLQETPEVTGYDFDVSVAFRRISLSGTGCATTGGTRPTDFGCQDEDH